MTMDNLKKNIFVVLLLFVSSISSGQEKSKETKQDTTLKDTALINGLERWAKAIENGNVPKLLPTPTVYMLSKWLDHSLLSWKYEMELYDFERNGIGEKGQNYYTSTLKKGSFTIERYPSKNIRIIHTCYDNSSPFDEFMNHIEHYYVESHAEV